MNLPTPATERRVERIIADLGVQPAAAEPELPFEHPVPRRVPVWQWVLSALLQLLVALAIVLGGIWLYKEIIASAPKAKRKPPGRIARLVDTAIVGPARTGPVIEAWGEVVAARTLVVRPEISGTVIWVHPELTPGGLLPTGSMVALLDDRDLKLAVARAEAAVAQIDAKILVEQGQAEVRRFELNRIRRNLTEAQKALILRKPQMAQLVAERAAAVATLDQAKNALKRAAVLAPFAAIVISEKVAPGAMVTTSSDAATLVAADPFHVTLSVPASSLGWLRFDGSQSVRLFQVGAWSPGQSRAGRIVRKSSKLSTTGRMAEVIVEVKDPLARGPGPQDRPSLLLGSFVKGTIATPPIAGAVLLDRAHLRDDETAWVMTPENRLEVRKLEIAWRGPGHVLVTKGLKPGERIVTTRLATFAPGMALRTRNNTGGGKDRAPGEGRDGGAAGAPAARK